jgi:hypothetical protein
MTTHRTGTREEWPAARLELFEAEKDLTRCGDGLARRREELPLVLLPWHERLGVPEPTQPASTKPRRSRVPCVV